MLLTKTTAGYSLKDYLNNSLVLAEYMVLIEYTELLRQHVAKFGWPDHIVNQLEIVHHEGAPTIAYPKELENEIKTLNYGTQDIPPSPALSTFSMGAI